jgi:hypothetical protein
LKAGIIIVGRLKALAQAGSRALLAAMLGVVYYVAVGLTAAVVRLTGRPPRTSGWMTRPEADATAELRRQG